MKKIKNIFVIIICVFIGILLIIFITYNKKFTIKIDGVNYAILVNGEYTNSFPSGNYKVNIKCSNSDSYWDSLNHKIIIKNISGEVACDVSFNSISNNDYLNNYIINLNNSNQGNGIIMNENGYRYEGANPNNYIWFNNELWRIIGVFGSTNHGVSNKNLVKIIRNQYIGTLQWNNSDSNNWSSSSLKYLLNNHYYNWEVYKSSANSYCYKYSTIDDTVKSVCDYSVKGIKDEYRPMIMNVTWYLGGPGKTGYTSSDPDDIYSYERNSQAIYSGSYSTLGYIGLVYYSDYLYASPSELCDRTKLHMLSNNGDCIENNWMSHGMGWFITQSSANNRLVLTKFGSSSTIYGNYVQPVLYLSNNVYRVSGTGTITDPYIIGMAS